MNKEVFVPYTLDSVGIYPYPEMVSLFTAFFENTATKWQLDEVDKHMRATKSRYKISDAYEYYQTHFFQPTNTGDKE